MKELELKIKKLEARDTKEEGCTCCTNADSIQTLLNMVVDSCATCCT